MPRAKFWNTLWRNRSGFGEAIKSLCSPVRRFRDATIKEAKRPVTEKSQEATLLWSIDHLLARARRTGLEGNPATGTGPFATSRLGEMGDTTGGTGGKTSASRLVPKSLRKASKVSAKLKRKSGFGSGMAAETIKKKKAIMQITQEQKSSITRRWANNSARIVTQRSRLISIQKVRVGVSGSILQRERGQTGQKASK
jgi:hypothetical protein